MARPWSKLMERYANCEMNELGLTQATQDFRCVYRNYNLGLFPFPTQSFTFLNKKCERSYLMKRNPRKVTWTVLYRRKHKKGIEEEQTRKRTRRTQKFQRSIVGASLTEIMAKRNMKPEVRKAQREQAIK